MASTTEKPTVHESQNESPTGPEPCVGPSKSALELLREYGRERPEVIALWCFGIGFVMGWKLKPW
jgi:hypothetical protein